MQAPMRYQVESEKAILQKIDIAVVVAVQNKKRRIRWRGPDWEVNEQNG